MGEANPVVLTPRPFAPEVSLHEMAAGMSVEGMVRQLEAAGHLDRSLRPWLRINAGGMVLTPRHWRRIRPKAGVALQIEVLPASGSNAGRVLAQIAIIVISQIVGGHIGGTLGKIAAAAIFVAGNLAVNALMPIKQPDQKARRDRYSLSGASNAARPHEQVAILLGRRRIYPSRCANWFTETVDNVVYLRQLFQPSVSWCERSTPRLGQTDLASLDGVTIRWNTKPDDGLSLTWFGMTPCEDTLALPVKGETAAVGDWVTRTAPQIADRLSLDIGFLAGLFNTKESSGNPEGHTVTFEFRYGLKGVAADDADPIPFGTAGVIDFRDPPAGTRRAEAWRQTFAWDVDQGEYDVHIRRISHEPTSTRISDEMTWVCLRAFKDEPAIRDADSKPWIELELKATDQLNGVPDDFNFIATSLVYEATETGPGATLIESRNPADLFLAASYPPFSDVDLDADERNFAAIADWRALCEAQGWHCDLVEDQELSVGELLLRVAATGRARPTLDYGALSVVVDWEKPLPRQMFTPRNVSGFKGELTYPHPVHALRLRFANEDKDWDEDIALVFAQDPTLETPGPYTLDTATLYESVDIRDKTDPDEVELIGARLLAEAALRPERFTFNQDIEYLTIREGDRALLAHHVALIGQVTARVRAFVVDPDDATHVGLRLDERVIMETGREYDLDWRPDADADIATFALETVAGEGVVVWFSTPSLAEEDVPQVGDLVAIREHAIELLDVVVASIAPKDRLTAAVTCVPYAPELQAIGTDPLPVYRTAASRPPTAGGALISRGDRERDRALDRASRAIEEASLGLDAAVSDGILTPGEKAYVVPAIQALVSARTALNARVADLLLDASAEAVAYGGASDDLDDVLATLTTPVAWDDTSDNTEVPDPAAFAAAYQAAIAAERDLQSAVAGKVIPGTVTNGWPTRMGAPVDIADNGYDQLFLETVDLQGGAVEIKVNFEVTISSGSDLFIVICIDETYGGENPPSGHRKVVSIKTGTSSTVRTVVPILEPVGNPKDTSGDPLLSAGSHTIQVSALNKTNALVTFNAGTLSIREYANDVVTP